MSRDRVTRCEMITIRNHHARQHRYWWVPAIINHHWASSLGAHLHESWNVAHIAIPCASQWSHEFRALQFLSPPYQQRELTLTLNCNKPKTHSTACHKRWELFFGHRLKHVPEAGTGVKTGVDGFWWIWTKSSPLHESQLCNTPFRNIDGTGSMLSLVHCSISVRMVLVFIATRIEDLFTKN